jgi:hypothetical protein
MMRIPLEDLCMHRSRCLALWLMMGLGLSASVTSAAEPTSPKKGPRKESARRKIEQLEERLRDAEAAAAKSKSATNSPKATARYQLQTVGDRLVVLDMQTGETRVVDLTPPTPIQSVDVGHAWVVVTVLGNVSTPRPEPPAKSR